MSKKTKILVPTVVVAVLVLAVFVRNSTRLAGYEHTASNSCVSNLRVMESAKEQWGLEFHKTTNDAPTLQDIQPYMGRGVEGELPVCPDGGTYTPGRLGQPPTCSIGGPHHSLPRP